MAEVERDAVVNVRVTAGGLAAFDECCKTRGVRRSEAFRAAMRDWMLPQRVVPAALPAEQGVIQIEPGLSKADERELRQWRMFADRTAINGDPDRQVTPEIDMHGWTFMVVPQRDDNLEIA